ncbi:MAG TPA: hypothetical protein VNM34_09190 [Verrucomicrobiae bacterium]|nr:hypothetical protein [Verrucomicrobiae bacterium]
MRSRRSAALALLLVLAGLPILATGAAAGGGTGATSRHDAIVAYWTEARMRAAVPRDFVLDPARGFHIAPDKGKPGGRTGGTTTGASWPNGKGDVYRLTGKVFFNMAGGSWVCSGTALTDSRSAYTLVVTAGHCAYDESVIHSSSAFATNWMFIPQFDSSPTFSCSATAYGCWTASALVINDGFASAGGFNTRATHYDWAFAVVGAGSNGTQLDALGTFGLTPSSVGSGTVVDAFGYPAAGKYHGNDLTYCQGPVGFDALTSNTNYKLACGMTGGSSGGPWFSGFASADGTSTGNTGTIQSLNSYGYSGQSNMYGPIFNIETNDTLTAAHSATTTNTFVSCRAPCQ